MNIKEGRLVFYFDILVATFTIKPHKQVCFIQCPKAYQEQVLRCVEEYAKTTEAISIIANVALSDFSNTLKSNTKHKPHQSCQSV
jgi:hypothetical protein